MMPNHSGQIDYRVERERLVELEKARKLWVESKKILNILRTQPAQPLTEPTPEELLQWYQQNLNSSPSSAS